ncbi:hypothetical protein J2Z76_000419 [Sedimentibacter acidaminivorans]|uniref:AAA-like domain protein n=1 Tax=Sedimentibacter acidaminivorans TaxID=913099 RepID=A0ABS4GA49_9FIRM|nr:hypothetical protein [Sedimentibacter acidaminivorans]MBP1924566.1 hypothetical protein [Sedimentibacter acidaminivorans]
MKIELSKPNYIYLKIIPSTSIRNNDTYKILQAIQSIYKPFLNRFTFYDYKQILNKTLPDTIKFELPCKVSYMIYISKKTVEFYFIVDERYKGVLKEALSRVWSSVTIFSVDKLPKFSSDSMYKQLVYAKEDALSLNVDRRDNDLISNNLNIIDTLQQGDKVGIFYNFIPTNQYTWRATFKNTVEKYKKGIPVDNNKINVVYAFKSIFNELYSTVNMFNTKPSINISSNNELSKTTQNKGSEFIINTQIALIGDSHNKLNTINNLRSLANSFRSIDEDNYLKYKSTKKFNYIDLNIGTELNKCSTKECGNFLSLPGRELLERFEIEHINTLEVEVPEELRTGYIRLGCNTFKGNAIATTMSKDKNLANLGLVALGPQGCGKSTYFANYCKDVITAGESLIVIDFIKNCELSEEIKNVVPKNKLIELDLSKQENMQSFSFNEVANFNPRTGYERLEVANMQTQLLIAFIDAINIDQKLSPRMRRSLAAAANIVFIHSGMSMRNVYECLSNHRKRLEYIAMVPEDMKLYLEDDIFNLDDMNEVDGKTGEISGTKTSKSDFILDRINLLMEDIKLKYMFNKPMDSNIDFIKSMDQGKIILIKIPDSKYPTVTHKNILTTFFVSKIWLASQLRGGMYKEPKRTHIIIDEVFQAPTAEFILKDVLVQARKFQTKFIFSAHYLSQIDTIKEALKASGSSYMLMQGTDKKNFEELKEDLAPFELQDLLNLKRYNSLNLIKTSNGYAKFITALPKPI